MKRYLRIGGAFAIGGMIVLGAFYISRQKTESVTEGPVVTVAPKRTAIEIRDTNDNGIADWEETLGRTVYESITAPTSTFGGSQGVAYIPPTTLTGKFAEVFFKSYIEQGVAESTPEVKDAFITDALKTIETTTVSKAYTPLDIVIVDDSPEAFHTYGNEILRIAQSATVRNENEIFILQRALESKNPAVLDELKPIYEAYGSIIDSTLLVPTPRSLLVTHIALLTAYESIRTDVSAMGQMFVDPLYAFARVKRYEEDANSMLSALKDLHATLRSEGITYTKNEPGALLYLLAV